MKLCIDARMIHSSGIGTYIRNILPGFSPSSFELTTLGQTVPFSAPIYSLQEQIAFPWKIPRCDLFWSPHYNTPLLPIRARRRVSTIHDVCHLARPMGAWHRRAAYTLLKNACIRSDLILTVSHFSKLEIVKYLQCPESKIHVVYPGVNTQEFSPSRRSEKIMQRYGLSSPFFLFVGNSKPHKNLSILLEAFENLGSKDCHLALVGNYPKNLAKANIHLLGKVPGEDLPSLYAGAFALIFPSLYEGFGSPPLEAMASGCPVIASNAASIPEVCKEAALYFSPTKSQELKSQMERLLQNPSLAKSLIEKGLSHTRLFPWQKTQEEIKELLYQI